MKRRNFLHWVLSLPIVGSVVKKATGESDLKVLAKEVMKQHDRRKAGFQQYADEVAKIFGSMFWDKARDEGFTSRLVKTDVSRTGRPTIDNIVRKYVVCLYGDEMNLLHKSRIVLAVGSLVESIEKKLLEFESKKVVFFTPSMIVSPGCGFVQAISEAYGVPISVALERPANKAGVYANIEVVYGIDMS